MLNAQCLSCAVFPVQELLEQLEPSILPKHTREHRLIERIVDRYKESQAAFCRQLAEEQDDDRMQEYNLALDKLKHREEAAGGRGAEEGRVTRRSSARLVCFG